MRAELDIVNGKPVLHLERGGNFGSKRASFDLPLTSEQAKSIAIHTELSS